MFLLYMFLYDASSYFVFVCSVPLRGGGNSTRGNQSTIGGRGSGNSNSGPITRPMQRRQTTSVGDDAIVCQCSVDAIQLTVRKEGANQGSSPISTFVRKTLLECNEDILLHTGRPFYKCGNNSSCDFFMWADEGQAAPQGGRNSHQTTLSSEYCL